MEFKQSGYRMVQLIMESGERISSIGVAKNIRQHLSFTEGCGASVAKWQIFLTSPGKT
jgi:hypothetical protein